MFAYCGNNPISRADTGGTLFFTVLGSLVCGVFGAIDAAISYAQGESTAQEAAASVLGSIASGFVTGLATDVLAVTGGTIGVVVGTMAVAGAVGSLLSTGIEASITGNTIDPVEMVCDAAYAAGTGALFAYVGYSSNNNLDLIKNGRLLAVVEDYILHDTGKKEAVEEVLAGACDFVLGFTLDILSDRFEQACFTGG